MKPLYKDNQPQIPAYIRKIACRLKETNRPYIYRLNGVNRYRPAYGIHADLEALAKWAELHYADMTIHQTNTTYRSPHFAVIELTDPVCLALERAGLIYTMADQELAKNAHPQTEAEKAAALKRDRYMGRKEIC